MYFPKIIKRSEAEYKYLSRGLNLRRGSNVVDFT